MPFQKIELPIRSEWRGGFTVGTLSLIRRIDLERSDLGGLRVRITFPARSAQVR